MTRGVHFIKLELSEGEKVVSENFYWQTSATAVGPAAATVFGAGGVGRGGARGGTGRGPGGAAGAVEDFSALQTMPTAELAVTLNRHDADGKCLIDATVTNPTKIVAVNAHLQLRNGRTHERVLPVVYSDNFVSLLPGESRVIAIEAGGGGLGADKPEVVVDGWNVGVVEKVFDGGGGASVALNKEAFVGPK